jgi:hypothetical protein
MGRQRAAARSALGRTVAAQIGITFLRLGVTFGDGLLKRFEAQLQLLLRQPLGLRTELHAPELQQQMAQPVVLRQQGITFHRQRIALDNRRQHQRAQCRGIFGQAL